MINETKRIKILEALKTIQEVCDENSCDTCPFRGSYSDCKIQNMPPVDWILKTEAEDWRAFEV